MSKLMELWNEEEKPNNNLDFNTRLEAAKQAYKHQFNKELPITSRIRSREEQQNLYDRFRRGEKGIYMPINPADYPEKKVFHENAADISTEVPESFLNQFGLHRPLGKNDPVHTVADQNFKGTLPKFEPVVDKPKSNLASLWHEEDITPSVTLGPIEKITQPEVEQEIYTPEGAPLITSQTAYEPRGVAKLAQQGLGGIVSAPVSAALGAAEPVIGVAQIVNKARGGKEDFVNAFNQMQQGLKESSGPLSYATNRPAELAGELGPGVTNLASNIYKTVPLASDLAKGVIAGTATGAVQGALQPTETGLTNEEFAKQKLKNAAISSAIGGAFPVALKGLQAANSATGLNLGASVPNAPSQQSLVQEAKNLYKKAEDSGIRFKSNEFANEMFRTGHALREEGFTPKAYPGIDSVLNEMVRTDVPKDFTELQALRKMIQGQQKSIDPETRRIASILKDRFDDYVINAPIDHISTGQKTGLQDWQEARASYSKLKKAEIFDDMLEQAQMEGKNLYTQSGAENSLAKQLRQLVKNDKRMRTFTPDEQKAIKEAAKGGSIQNLLRFYGKFAPTSPVSAIFSGGASYANPAIGIPFTIGATAARAGATKLREQSVTNLADLMRLGGEAKIKAPQTNIGDLLKLYEMEK